MNIVGELLEKSGMSQKELSITMGIAQPSISAWVNQKADPTGKNARRIAEIFGVDRDSIVYDDVRPAISNLTDDDLLRIADYVHQKYQSDDETWTLRERYRRDPNYRLLFDAAEKAKPEHLRAAAAMLKALEGTSDD